jgi:putative transcriptional regulator
MLRPEDSISFCDQSDRRKQAAKHAAGRKGRGLRASKVALPDVKAIRLALRMSQHHFAAAYRIPLPTLKNWEQGRRMPDAPAAAYLLAIKRRPKEVSWKPWRGHERFQWQLETAPSRAVSPPFPSRALVGYGLTPCLIEMPTFWPA